MSVRLITHNDLDGSACAIIANHYMPYVHITHENHNTITDTAKDVIERAEDYDFIFFTDICPQEQEVIQLSKFPNVHILDHHATIKELADKFDIITLDLDKCGALVFYWHLVKYLNIERDKGLEDFLVLVDVFDRWDTDDPVIKEKGDDLCRLYNFYGTEWFEKKRDFNEFTIHNTSETEKHILNILHHKEEIHFKKMMKELQPFPLGDHMFALSFVKQNAPAFKDMVTKTKLYDGLIVPYVDGNSATIFCRKGVDGTKYSEPVGGGGHPQASGFSYDFKEKIKGILKDLLEKGSK